MLPISLIAVDLDGTLLRNDHTISKYTCEVWQKLLEKGIHVIPTTGRPFTALEKTVPIHLCEYLICTNGVHIYRKEDKKFSLIWDQSLNWQIAEEVFKIKERDFAHIHMHCYIGNKLYTRGATKELDEYTQRTNIPVTMLAQWNEIAHSTISKIMCVSEHEELTHLQSTIRNAVPTVTATFSMLHYLEVFACEASKSHALLHVMKSLNLNAATALALGDSYNDVPMLEMCKHAYVMKNAPPSLSPQLPRTDYTNDEDGLARLLEKLLL